MNWLDSPLLRALRTPAEMARFGAKEWELAIQQARSSQLLGRLGALAQRAGIEPPQVVLRHLTGMASIVQKQHDAVRWEVGRIARALAGTGEPVLLLKGTAYVMSASPAALGRVFSDVDILVQKPALARVENALQIHGWVTAAAGEYDQRYYRTWMHELPPMIHMHRQTALDVHHNLLPETAKIKTRPDLVMAARRPVQGYTNIFVPALVDQILHSACHLFHEGEWKNGLRDLSDLDLMMRKYLIDEKKIDELESRARDLNLLLPLSYAVRCAHHVFGTPLPPSAMGKFQRARKMDAVFIGAIRSAHHSLAGPSTRWMEAALYIRSHYLRMPLRLLVPHLVHQMVAREGQKA
ncbi:nucleotidyltransferase domain-containing protein [Pseudorhodoferax sp.]|uniref:nucleotidyltransferase domain-containing protein n=1 Tax=Pseudorhodoferax sp. TaxID=1993553 RepID=UPI002DD6738B|nr:nucleotidyltransferase family protein [Pseudorhodoferax sp.]